MYCINPESDEPIFCLFDPIGKDSGEPGDPYIDGNEFAKEMLAMDDKGKKRFQIWINSEGGSVKDGYSIISTMLRTKTKVDTLVVGIAYSIAGVIALMGRKVEAMDFSALMFHNPYNPDGSMGRGLEVIRKSLVTAVCSRTGKTDIEVENIFNATTFYQASEAKAQNIIDCVVNSGETNIPHGNAIALQALAKQILNKLLPPIQKQKQMKQTALALGLSPDASDESIAAEIVRIQNKTKAEDDAKLAAANAAKLEAENKLADLQKAKDKEVADAKIVAENAAKEAVKVSNKAKIVLALNKKELPAADADVEKYAVLAGDTEVGATAVLDMIEAIPTIKKAASLGTYNKSDDKTGIPLIQNAGTDKAGNPIAGDTTGFVNAINSFSIKAFQAKK
jgi:ATP-dependent protease ClpP protease subunit